LCAGGLQIIIAISIINEFLFTKSKKSYSVARFTSWIARAFNWLFISAGEGVGTSSSSSRWGWKAAAPHQCVLLLLQRDADCPLITASA